VLLKNRPAKGGIIKTPCPTGQGVKVAPFDFAKATLRVKIIKLIKVSILKATNRESESSVAGIHTGTAATEVEVARTGAANRTAPIDAAGTDTEERTIAADAVARHGQFKR
jgi:hypothetical protein